jgi:glucose dehydrogenase
VPAIAHAGKTGWVYVLDRRTGKSILRSEAFVPHENMWAEPTELGTRVAPGIAGGANWQPMAYSPRTGLLYVRGQHTPSVYHRMVREHTVGERYDGGVASPARGEAFATTTAIDAATGKIKWQLKTEEPMLASPLCGGALATAGDVVFYGDTQGYLNAVDATTGEGLWRSKTSGGVQWIRSTPVTFSAGGKQYVAITTLPGLVTFAFP